MKNLIIFQRHQTWINHRGIKKNSKTRNLSLNLSKTVTYLRVIFFPQQSSAKMGETTVYADPVYGGKV